MDNGKRYYVIDRSVREFTGTILECDLLEHWFRSCGNASVHDWTLTCKIGDEFTDNTRNLRVIRTR